MKQKSATPALTLAASSFAALGSEQRLLVLRTLVRAGSAGHHLKLLASAGLVKQEKQGRSTICAAVAYEEVRALANFLLTECCADAINECTEHDHG